MDEVHNILVALGPQILRKQRWLPISLRTLHKIGARYGRITKLLGRVQVTWEMFRTTLLERFFPR